MLPEILFYQQDKEVEELFAFTPYVVEILSWVIIPHHIDEKDDWLHSCVILYFLSDAKNGRTKIFSDLCAFIGKETVS